MKNNSQLFICIGGCVSANTIKKQSLLSLKQTMVRKLITIKKTLKSFRFDDVDANASGTNMTRFMTENANRY
jgi:hypothetical protein